MNWNIIVPLVGPVLTLVVLGFWRYTDDTGAKFERIEAKFERIEAKFERIEAKFDAKFDALNKLLTDNLIAINRDIGKLKGRGGT